MEEKEIDRELNLMKEAGIGGVELQILYPLHRDDREKGVQNVPYFSPRFFELTGYAAHRCRELGLRFDFTPGSSWPYGGPPITQEYAMQSALPYQIDIQGPCTYAHDFTTQFTGEVCAASLGKMENSRMLPETVRDVTGAFTDKYLFNWPWGTQMKAVEVPEGPHKLTIFVINRYRMMALKPCPNADGLVMDHCSAAALTAFRPYGGAAGQRLGMIWAAYSVTPSSATATIGAASCWRSLKKRGYSLSPISMRCGAIWGGHGRHSLRLFRTMSELTIENFSAVYGLEQGGATPRIRRTVHGGYSQGLCVRGYTGGETFGEHDKLECNTIHRRLASSSGHIYGKQIISNESFTWLKVPRFTETLQDLKAAVDAIFLDGMNMIVNHGYAYSPELAGPRGWPFYASCNINHTAGWWPLYHHVARYIQSCSALLREGVPVSDIAVYLPQADVWAENLLSDIHLAMKLEERIGRETADRINKAGYWFDYLNDEAVCSLGSITPAGLCIETNCYRTILLLQCTRLPLETAERLVEFVRAGGTLIADGVPCRSCGLVEGKTDHERVRALMDELFGGGCGRGRAIRVENKEQALLQCLHAQVKPDVRVEKNDTVGFVHRRCGEQELYFFSNISREAVRTALTFYQVFGGFRVLCAESGRELPVQGAEERGGRLSVTLQFKPMQSLYFVFSPELKPGEVWVQEADAPCACRRFLGGC
ncbi:MAG: glycosyl hydrolase [Hydrogeniiclostridium mannosilyticum]